jgi:hypothetical protein
MMAAHGEQGRQRPWHAVVPLARGQGLGWALGEAEQVRGEARQPGMQRIVAGQWRMAGEEVPTGGHGDGWCKWCCSKNRRRKEVKRRARAREQMALACGLK